MTLHSLARRALSVLPLAIAGATLAPPARAEKDVVPGNLRLVRGTLAPAPAGSDGAFVLARIDASHWKFMRAGTEDLTEQDRTATSITLASSGGQRWQVDLASQALTEPSTGARGRITYTSADTCTWWTPRSAGTPCTCDLRELRPLQGAVGLGEVSKKKKDVEDDFAKESADLTAHPIKIVRDGSNRLYVVDHHHGALAWLKAGYTAGACQYLAELPGDVDPWQELERRKWVRLFDQNGVPIPATSLPKTLGEEPDDPYRTLAWLLRKNSGYCRQLMGTSPPPFAEFLWADWLRQRPELPAARVASATAPDLWERRPGESKKQLRDRRDAAQRALVNAALDLSRRSGAASLPGYEGTRGLSGEQCNPKGEAD